jgi:tetratricopeptide (TPR) repeat protein
VHHNGTFRLGDDVPLLQEALREEGFETGAFVGAVVLDRQYGLARGFDRYDDRIGLRRAGEFGYAERRAAEVVRAALEWVARTDGRFFLWVHLFDPHADYDPPPPARQAFDDPYLAEIAYADAQLARLLNDIRIRWPEGNTLFVVTSDHGEGRGEHGEGGHSYTLYDVTQRVPLVMAGPGLRGGKVVSSPVRLSDVAPTILRMVGQRPPPGLDGRDLRPLWEGEVGEERSAYLETLAPRLDMGWSALYGLRSSRFKYVRAPRPELYDLENDPRELRNLASQRPELVKELDTALSARLEKARPVESTPVVDELRRAQIESLGYVVADSVEEVELGSVGGLDPKDGLAQLTSYGTALALLDEGRPDEALEGLLGVEEGGLLLELLRADAAIRAGRPQLAERFALAARELAGGEHPAVVLALADAYEAQGRWDEAEALLRAEAERDAAGGFPVMALGRIAEARGEPERAARLYREAAERRGSSPESVWRLAALRIENGEVEEADALLDRLEERERSRPAAVERLVRAELRAGLAERARSRLRAALRNAPRATKLLALRDELSAVLESDSD